ncbi:class I SAM-dependent RNA methyltransferase [Nocardia pseudobrasiliensis]|uniref:tRNA/tmRNA/rRNA uracil-C5-methylase (TrmA/RlmC/RlmD family) n=1 Tax=Nocardia pseudobrasiliensis TaxID=45979 RepID=A0A370I5R1_9NOCA|nr:TRAM domain-containing protein [Nocardia pseudobrasiliensis]RDI64664.1 tRNA/tmRNA/rRNA uracil-C5-methylase (TrmA/RlmC/RlmD family) [Nocardia pseudobrasiliensis]
MADTGWEGTLLELRLGAPGHGGFCVARHDGRVVFVRHGLPGELVRARVTEDRGGSFCRAEAVEILEPSPDRIEATCPVSGPGGAGCCDFAFATADAQRELKATVVAEQLRRLADWDTDVIVEPIPPEAGTDRWRTRIRLVVDADGRAGVHRYRSTEVVTDLRCPQAVPGALDGIAESRWTPGAELVIAVDGDGLRHIVELEPTQSGRRTGGDRRDTAARRAAAHGPRRERVLQGSGRAAQYVAGRRWEVAATGFWQPHRGAAQCYSDIVAEWADAGPGALAWDLYSGAGVFAARLAEQVGEDGQVLGIESSKPAVADGVSALRDLPQVDLRAHRVERWLDDQLGEATPQVIVLDPPRAGAGKQVVAAMTACVPARIVHIGCDPAAFARDIGLYRTAGYRPTRLRAFDAFPATHHVECLALLEPIA